MITAQVKTVIKNPDTGLWVEGDDATLVPQNVCAVIEFEGKARVLMNSGDSFYLNKTKAQVDTFLSNA